MSGGRKRILMLGGTGAMGVYLAPELLGLGHEVVVTSRSERESNERGISYIKGNAKDIAFLRPLLAEKYDAIIDFMVYNTTEFSQRCEELLESTPHYLFLSTYRVYGDNGSNPITEASPRLLDSVKDEEYLATDEYGLTKARQENMLKESAYKNWTILRPAITYSKDRFQLGTMEAHEFLYRALQDKPIIFPRQMLNKEATMSWAGDVAKLIARLVFNEKAMGEVLTVSTAEHHKWNEIVQYYKAILGVRVELVDLDVYRSIIGRPWQIKYDRMLHRIIDNSKALAATGLQQSDFMPLYDGLRIELANFSKNPNYAAINPVREKKIDIITFSYLDNLKRKIFYGLKKVYHMHKNNVPMLEIVKKVYRSSPAQRFLRPLARVTQLKSNILARFYYKGAIVTLTGNYNYGSVMQRWALQQFLKRSGYRYKLFDFSFMLGMSKRTGDRTNVARFVKEHLDSETFNLKTAGNYRSYIVGSDQVWRDFFNDWAKFGKFFLNFVKHKQVKRIGYAISFGKDTLEGANINPQNLKWIVPLVKRFDSVSVREQSGIGLVSQLGKDAERVLDPTLLMSAKDYSKLVETSPYKDRPTAPLFFYILDSNQFKENVIARFGQANSMEIDGIYPNNGNPLLPPELWLKGFRDSEFVFTDSFHGMVFSIVNHKPFMVFTNKARGVARMTELLDMLGIQNRIIVEGDKNIDFTSNPIDWEKVDAQLAALRKKSADWLISSLR